LGRAGTLALRQPRAAAGFYDGSISFQHSKGPSCSSAKPISS
jgi:hypothetical protein